MKKGQTSVRGGIEDFLCPFTDMYITQGSNGSYSHKGTMSNDVRGAKAGVEYPYYAPCTCKCVWTYPSYGQAMWQSVNKVRFANGRIDYATFMTCHDNSFNAKVGQIIKQGQQLGNMGTRGNATGVHCHIQISQSKDTSWFKNKYGIYQFNNEYDTDDCYFVDDTNIIEGFGGNWKKLSAVKVVETPKQVNTTKYVNLPPTISSWAFYKLGVSPVKKNASGTLNPKKFGGLSYKILGYENSNTCVIIQTQQFGKVKIYVNGTGATITSGKHTYSHGNF